MMADNPIELSSRCDVESEWREMFNFTSALTKQHCQALVRSVLYDSKANLCTFELAPGVDESDKERILEAAENHISQFEWEGTVYHGKPMPALDDEDLDDVVEPLPSVPMAPWRSDVPSFSQADQIQWQLRAGRDGEEALSQWFSDNQLGYVAICQNKEAFAKLFTGVVKRPDFLLLFDSLGLIAIDAKNLTLYTPHGIESYVLPLDNELKKAIAFERIFRIPVWYAIKGQNEIWYWISALKAFDVGDRQSNDKGNFIYIKLTDFVAIRTGDDLSKLYNQRTSYGNVAAIEVP